MANESDWTVEFFSTLKGYPWLPCPICKRTEGCDDTVPERARAAGDNLQNWPIG